MQFDPASNEYCYIKRQGGARRKAYNGQWTMDNGHFLVLLEVEQGNLLWAWKGLVRPTMGGGANLAWFGKERGDAKRIQ